MRGHIFLLKNEIGRSFWDNTAPIAVMDASVVTSNGRSKFGSVRVARDAMASLRLVKAVWAAVDHEKTFSLRISVRAAAVWA